jgi:hypothetical protein
MSSYTTTDFERGMDVGRQVGQVEIEQLRAENTKLRTLCLALYEFAYNEYPDSAELNFADCMDELGIEVDG